VGVSVGVSHELSSMAISIISLYKFYDGEEKLIQRAENALQSSRLVSFTYDGIISDSGITAFMADLSATAEHIASVELIL